jgi:hypothetical protein
MKKMILVMAAVMASSSAAFADGFVCETRSQDLNVKVYNHTAPEYGTRNAAVMVVSDPSVSHGRKTIARFTSVNGRITNKGAFYVADVDLRYKDSKRKGELIGGTKLGELDKIVLDVDFSYSRPIANGEEVRGMLSLNKRNGQVIDLAVDCYRYLKN